MILEDFKSFQICRVKNVQKKMTVKNFVWFLFDKFDEQKTQGELIKTKLPAVKNENDNLPYVDLCSWCFTGGMLLLQRCKC